MKVDREKLNVYLPRQAIAELNRTLGQKITQDYKTALGPDEELLVIVTLKGAAIFAADLVREIDVPLNIDFVRLASYGSGTKSSGLVRILKDIEASVTGKHVLVLDEIVDSGRTLQFLLERLKSEKPASVKVCTLLSKPSRREIEVTVDYLGTEVEDKFLVGYGLDFAERFRNLPEIYFVET